MSTPLPSKQEKPGRIGSVQEFWPFYVSQHRRQGTRVLHFAGTSTGLAFLILAVALARPAFILWGLVASYGLAWIGHFFIEKNRPATFTYPLWSLLSDFRMYGLMWRGKMAEEARRLGFPDPGRVSAPPRLA